MSLDDERINRTFSVFLICVGIAMTIGFVIGAKMTFLYFN